MMVWKMIFLFQWCILRFHVNLPGCRFVAQQPSMRPCDFIWFTALVSMKPFTSDRRNETRRSEKKKRHPANKVLPGSFCHFFKYVHIKVDRFTRHKSKIQGIHFGYCFFWWINYIICAGAKGIDPWHHPPTDIFQYTSSRWWFQCFSRISSLLGENDPIWRAYVSNGLTSHVVWKWMTVVPHDVFGVVWSVHSFPRIHQHLFGGQDHEPAGQIHTAVSLHIAMLACSKLSELCYWRAP